MNQIVNLKTLNLQSNDGPVAAIVMGLNIPELDDAEAFIGEAAEKFKLQRMASPPDTSVLLLTVVTEMPAARFSEAWRQLASRDKVLGHFMSLMKKADVVRGTAAGATLETVSLLERTPDGASRQDRGPVQVPHAGLGGGSGEGKSATRSVAGVLSDLLY